MIYRILVLLLLLPSITYTQWDKRTSTSTIVGLTGWTRTGTTVALTNSGDLISFTGKLTSDIAYATGTTVFYFRTSLTATSGTHNNLRARAQATATSGSTADIRGIFGQAVTNAGFYGGTGTGVFANFIAKNTSTTVNGRALFAEAETEATPTAVTDLIAGHFRTKAHLDPSDDYLGILVENEKLATGFLTDAYIKLRSTTWGAAESSSPYGIDMNEVTKLGTADIRLHNGDNISNAASGTITVSTNTVTTGTARRQAQKFFDAIAFFPSGTNSPGLDTLNVREEVYSFDTATAETLYVKWHVPKWFTVIDSMKIRVSSTDTNDDNAGFSISGVGTGDGELNNVNVGNAVADTLALGSTAQAIKVLTFTGTFPTLADGDVAMFRLHRDVSVASDVAADVRFHSLIIYYN